MLSTRCLILVGTGDDHGHVDWSLLMSDILFMSILIKGGEWEIGVADGDESAKEKDKSWVTIM